MTRDWGAERENLSVNSPFLKFQPGNIYKIEVLDEGSEPKIKEFPNGPKKQRDFQVKVWGGPYEGETKTWSLTMGGERSLYGMITYVFEHVGQSTGVVLNIKVTGEGMERRYSVQEYHDLEFADNAKLPDYDSKEDEVIKKTKQKGK